MFFLIPWRVDVPQDRWPVINWLIIVVTIGVFALQIADIIEYETRQDLHAPHTRQSAPGTTTPQTQPAQDKPQRAREIPGITSELMLRGWSLKGLFGYMWLHAGLFHLLGNMLFLWIFGNAVCAKVGNVRYFLLYIFLGVIAGVVHLLSASGPVLGASGAINGVVGMYLVLFYENEITCLFVFWFIVPYVRWFAVGSVSMISFWLLWDIVGALRGGSGVAYFAHLGGFLAGFGAALLMCKKGWITMEKYEKSLLQIWQERRAGAGKAPLNADYARLGLVTQEQEDLAETSAPAPEPDLKPIPLPPLESKGAAREPSIDAFIRTACACGRTIRVSRQYAGRTVRCPNCKQGVVIPHQSDSFGVAPPQTPDRPIRLTCRCGQRLQVPARYAGRTGKCPQCGAKLKIPSISA
jgi:membrane associated rhomboid family serine protease